MKEVKKAQLIISVGKRKAYSYDLLELIVRCGYSKSEAKRLISQDAVKISIEINQEGCDEIMTDDEKTNGEEVTTDAPTEDAPAEGETKEEKTEQSCRARVHPSLYISVAY